MASRKAEIKNCFGNLNEMQAAKKNQSVTGNMPTSAPSLPIVLSDLSLPAFHAFSVPAEVKAGICWNRVGKTGAHLRKPARFWPVETGNLWSQENEVGQYSPLKATISAKIVPNIKNCKNALSQKKRSFKKISHNLEKAKILHAFEVAGM